MWAWLVSWWAPDADKFKEAVRRTAALVSAGIVGLALSPYGLWAAIAAAFVGGQRIGGSFNTALNRLQVCTGLASQNAYESTDIQSQALAAWMYVGLM